MLIVASCHLLWLSRNSDNSFGSCNTQMRLCHHFRSTAVPSWMLSPFHPNSVSHRWTFSRGPIPKLRSPDSRYVLRMRCASALCNVHTYSIACAGCRDFASIPLKATSGPTKMWKNKNPSCFFVVSIFIIILFFGSSYVLCFQSSLNIGARKST